MHMSVKHVNFGISVFIELVLAVITQNRIVAQDDFTPAVVSFLIGSDPDKTARVILFIRKEPVMVAFNQVQPSVAGVLCCEGMFGALMPRPWNQSTSSVVRGRN